MARTSISEFANRISSSADAAGRPLPMRLLLFALGVVSCAIAAVLFGYVALFVAILVYRVGPMDTLATVFSVWQLPVALGGSMALGIAFLYLGFAIFARHRKAAA
jgi:hypothetical protein